MTGVVREPCPSCGSSDNLARYPDGHAYCFTDDCKHYEPAADGEALAAPKRPPSDKWIYGEFRRLEKRKLTEETCRKFGYSVGEKKGRTVQLAEYRGPSGVVGQKVRTKDKEFWWNFADGYKKAPLFGQHLWPTGGRRLVITEGEIDAMSVSQAQDNRWPVVSVPNGAGGAEETVLQELEWIESYDVVVFAFDMDDPGQSAAKKCAALLSPGKARIANLPLKDANECLVAGKQKALIDALWQAKQYLPDGVVDLNELLEEALKPIQRGRPWPFPSLTAKTYGRRTGEVYGLGAGSGCGKSTTFKQIAAHILETEPGSKVAGIFLEEDPKHTLRTLGGMLIGARTHVPDVEFDEEALRRCLTDTVIPRLHLFNYFGAADWDKIKSTIRYYAHLGCRDIFLDHLTALAASVDDRDERRGIDRIMADLASLAKHLDVCIYFVSHLTTPEGKPHEEGGRVHAKHFRGSRAIAYWSHFLFALERDTQDPESTTVFRCLKDRYTGDANGLTFGLEYDLVTGRYSECELPDDETDEKWRPETTGDF